MLQVNDLTIRTFHRVNYKKRNSIYYILVTWKKRVHIFLYTPVASRVDSVVCWHNPAFNNYRLNNNNLSI